MPLLIDKIKHGPFTAQMLLPKPFAINESQNPSSICINPRCNTNILTGSMWVLLFNDNYIEVWK